MSEMTHNHRDNHQGTLGKHKVFQIDHKDTLNNHDGLKDNHKMQQSTTA